MNSFDETAVIEKIKQYGCDIFDEPDSTYLGEYTLNDQIDFNLSQQSSSNQQERIKPFLNSHKYSPFDKSFNNKNSSKYAQNYISPYSRVSYQQPSTHRTNYTSFQNQSTGKKIRKKIFSLYESQKSIEKYKKQQKKKRKSSNSKFSHVKSRYKQQQPLMKDISGYIEKNIYGRMKTEAEFLNRQKKMTREQSQRKWGKFIQKEKEWEQKRKNSILQAKIKEFRDDQDSLRKRPIRKSPPKMSVEQCLNKLRRQTDKLKKRLQQTNFEPNIGIKSYETERRKYKIQKQRKSKQKLAKSNLFDYYHKFQKEPYTRIQNPQRQLDFILQ